MNRGRRSLDAASKRGGSNLGTLYVLLYEVVLQRRRHREAAFFIHLVFAMRMKQRAWRPQQNSGGRRPTVIHRVRNSNLGLCFFPFICCVSQLSVDQMSRHLVNFELDLR